MSRLERFLGKPEVVEIDGEKFEINPLYGEDFDLVVKLGDKTNTAEAMREMMRKTLKQAVPDMTNEEFQRLPMSFLNKIMESIMRVNGMEMDKLQKEKLIQEIKQ